MKAVQVLVEHRQGEDWSLLGTFHPEPVEALTRRLEAATEGGALRGVPQPCSFAAWLATMRLSGERHDLGNAELASLRIGRMVGGDLSRLVQPSSCPTTWFSGPELERALHAASLPPTWRALVKLVKALPDGRAIVLFG